MEVITAKVQEEKNELFTDNITSVVRTMGFKENGFEFMN
jgi:hypothetical protein